MKSLFIFIYDDKVTATLLDNINKTVVPVYDVNDRKVKSYTYSLFQNGKFGCLSNYATEVALSKGQEYDYLSQNISAFYTENFLKDYINEVQHPNHTFNSFYSFALLLKKISFDADYASSFEGFNNIVFIINRFTKENDIEQLIFESFKLVNLYKQPTIVYLGDLIDYVTYDPSKENYFWGSDILLILNDTIAHLNFTHSNIKLTNYYTWEFNLFFNKFISFLSINFYGLPNDLDRFELIKLRYAYFELLNELDANPDAKSIGINLTLRGNFLFSQIPKQEIDIFFKDLLIQTFQNINFSKEFNGNLIIVSSILNSKYLESLASILLSQVIGKRSFVKFYSDETIRHLFFKQLWNLSLFENNMEATTGGAEKVIDSHYFISYYNPKIDSISYLKIFNKAEKIPVFSNFLFKGRFPNQDRIYFEIWKGIENRPESKQIKAYLINSLDIDFSEYLTIAVKLSNYGGGDLKIEAFEKFSGKKLDVLIVHEDIGCLAENLNQQLMFRQFKLLNNYMDKKKEQSMGIF